MTHQDVEKFLSDKALDQDRTLLSKKVLIILSFICGLTPGQIRELKLKDLYKDHNSGNLCLKLKQSSKTEKTCQIPSEKYSKVVTQYFDRIYEDTGSAEGYLMRTVHGYKFMEKRMGVNTIFAVGSDIARYLKLVNPEKYGINAPPNFPTAHTAPW